MPNLSDILKDLEEQRRVAQQEMGRIDRAIDALQTLQAPSARGAGRRKRRTMSARARKEVSIRMKRYWAKRRAESAGRGGRRRQKPAREDTAQ